MLRVGINGFGRIGRSVLRALHSRDLPIQIVALNDTAPLPGLAHLLEYDSAHGRFPGEIDVDIDNAILRVDQQAIKVFQVPHLGQIPWTEQQVDVVFECTGRFSGRQENALHLGGTVKKVLLSQPGSADVDNTIIFGVNEHSIRTTDTVISNGSCTTNCIVPVIKVLAEQFGIEQGTITTIHSSMHDQQVIDAYHPDLRRARAASQSIIPVDTRLAQGIERILPEFKGRFEAIAVRVPTINVTAMDLSVSLQTPVTIDKVNQAFINASKHNLKGILGFVDKPLVSIDFNHDPRSSILDGTQTRVTNGTLLKTLVWCDNEWGYANRMLDTASKICL